MIAITMHCAINLSQRSMECSLKPMICSHRQQMVRICFRNAAAWPHHQCDRVNLKARMKKTTLNIDCNRKVSICSGWVSPGFNLDGVSALPYRYDQHENNQLSFIYLLNPCASFLYYLPPHLSPLSDFSSAFPYFPWLFLNPLISSPSMLKYINKSF